MRKFERRRLEVPVEIALKELVAHQTEYLKDVSIGGLCFIAKAPVKENTVIHIRMPLTRPVFKTSGKVVWCKKVEDHYEVGVAFSEMQDRFKVRMFEQVCHIENYKKEILDHEGRTLTGEQAALEWIAKYAKTFDVEPPCTRRVRGKGEQKK